MKGKKNSMFYKYHLGYTVNINKTQLGVKKKGEK